MSQLTEIEKTSRQTNVFPEHPLIIPEDRSYRGTPAEREIAKDIKKSKCPNIKLVLALIGAALNQHRASFCITRATIAEMADNANLTFSNGAYAAVLALIVASGFGKIAFIDEGSRKATVYSIVHPAVLALVPEELRKQQLEQCLMIAKGTQFTESVEKIEPSISLNTIDAWSARHGNRFKASQRRPAIKELIVELVLKDFNRNQIEEMKFRVLSKLVGTNSPYGEGALNIWKAKASRDFEREVLAYFEPHPRVVNIPFTKT